MRKQKTILVDKLYDGRLRLERRNGSPNITARAYIQGRSVSKSTGESAPNAVRKIATDWYLDLLGRKERGENIHGKTFAECAEAFLKHADAVKEVTEGQRRNYYQKWSLLKKHFTKPDVLIANVDAAFLVKLRDTRKTTPVECLDAKGNPRPSHGKTPSNATIKKDLNFVSLVCRHAKEWMKCLDTLPEFPSFRGRAWKVKVNPRPHLNTAQWRRLRQLAKDRMNEEGLNPRARRQRQELYCFLLLCVGAALRVDEAYSIRWKDCEEVVLKDGTEAVKMHVFGKHATVENERELAYALYEGVSGYRLLKSLRPDAKPEDDLFTENHHSAVVELLEELDLRGGPGALRSSKSLRQTGISLRLEQGDNLDIRDIAKWARTKAAHISAFYDLTHPEQSVERITGFRKKVERKPKNEKEAERMKASEAALRRAQEQVRQAAEDPGDAW